MSRVKKFVKLTPSRVIKSWGGLTFQSPKGPVGELWEISTHKQGPSQLMGKSLREFFNLSYMAKLIDTSDYLSIQVHPTDELARLYENDNGKSECWIILDAQKNAGIYIGLKPGIDKEKFWQCLKLNAGVQECLNFIPVAPGQFINVPAGAIHAIGAGVTLAEIQQSSDVTYRLWDWNRLGADGQPRELHIDKGLRAINFDEGFNRALVENVKECIWEEGQNLLIKHRAFRCETICIAKNTILNLTPKQGLMLLEGSVMLEGEKLEKYQSGICFEAISTELEVVGSIKALLISEERE